MHIRHNMEASGQLVELFAEYRRPVCLAPLPPHKFLRVL